MDQKLAMDCTHSLKPVQVQSLHLLALNNQDLEKFLNNEYLENPLFEIFSDHKKDGGDKGSEMDMLANISSERGKDLKDYIREQLAVAQISVNDWKIINYLIECLDENGFFSTPAAFVAMQCSEQEEDVRRCLAMLRELEPCGVFSESLKECLKQQIKKQGKISAELSFMIENHLEDVARGDYINIAKNLKISLSEAKYYANVIRELNPRPASGFGTECTRYIIPDIIIRKSADSWQAVINDSWMDQYRISEYYVSMIAKTEDKELKGYLRKKLERARYILQGVERRRQTILDISYVILEYQRNFFSGEDECRPMVMEDIARRLGIHSTTVGRAIKDKYLEYPGGTIPVRSLFKKETSRDSGGQGLTSSQLKRKIKELVDQEDKRKPLSDQNICEMLKKSQIHVSRRVIAKYRNEMGIPSSLNRKDVG